MQRSPGWSRGSATTIAIDLSLSRALRRLAAAVLLLAVSTTAALLAAGASPVAAVSPLPAAAVALRNLFFPPRYRFLNSRDLRHWTLVRGRDGATESRRLLDCYCTSWLVVLRLSAESVRWLPARTVLLPADAVDARQHRRLRAGLWTLRDEP